MTITMNLLHDYASCLSGELAAAGYAVGPADPDDLLVQRWLNWKRRSIPPAPRAIHHSREFTPPTDPACSSGLTNIERIVTVGGDLTPYLSTNLAKPDYSDAMLDDWGIHHLHLGTGPHPKYPRFVNRTGPVLFARFEPNNAYFIKIYEHQEWANPDALVTLARNWPALVEVFRVRGVVGVAYDALNEEDIKALRKGNVNPVLKIPDGSVLMPPGKGRTAAGTSVDVQMKLNGVRQDIRKAERYVQEQVALDPARFGAPPHIFKLTFSGGQSFAEEQGSKERIRIFD